MCGGRTDYLPENSGNAMVVGWMPIASRITMYRRQPLGIPHYHWAEEVQPVGYRGGGAWRQIRGG